MNEEVSARNGSPFCPEAVFRSTLSDEDFWAHVLGEGPEYDEDDYIPDEDSNLALDTPCSVCSSTGACGYDSEGRALIHAEGYREE